LNLLQICCSMLSQNSWTNIASPLTLSTAFKPLCLSKFKIRFKFINICQNISVPANSKNIHKTDCLHSQAAFLSSTSLISQTSYFSRLKQVQEPVNVFKTFESPRNFPQQQLLCPVPSTVMIWRNVKKITMKLFLFGVIKCKLYEIVTDAIWCIFIASYCFAPSSPPFFILFNSLTYVCI
jgi:hypothetical protein